MRLKVIKAKKEYNEALVNLEKVFDAKPGTSKGDDLEILALLIDQYEKDHFLIEAPDSIEAVKFRMKQLGMKQKDLKAE
jgi:HTH-type transcriptional regulator/antitoxin HigA